jgi:hypothetical protein
MATLTQEKVERKSSKSAAIPALFLFLLLGFFIFRGSVNYGLADASDNVRGWAWSSTVGWVSFNCLDSGSCASSDYGVNIDLPSMNFSGYAWSSGVGWISFQSNGAPDYSFNVNCPGTCNNSVNCTACFNPDDGLVWGWAHIVSMGANGWIKLRDSANLWPGTELDLASASSSWRGWGWNGNDDGTGIGWVNYNCLDSGSCLPTGPSDYMVWMKGFEFPVVDNLSAPNWSFEDACVSAARGFTLRWDIEDKRNNSITQSAYRVIINTVNSTSSPVFDSGKRFSASEQYSTTSSILNYNTSYYWWVKAWNSLGLASPWFQFNTATPSSTLTDNIAANMAISPDFHRTFTTYMSEFPDVDYSYSPQEPRVDEAVHFADSSFFYSPAAPSTPVSCDEIHCTWNWTGEMVKTNSTPTASTTDVVFGYGQNDFSSTVSFVGTGYTCTTTKNIFVDLLPGWKEINPSD